jgi:hypothetical protein
MNESKDAEAFATGHLRVSSKGCSDDQTERKGRFSRKIIILKIIIHSVQTRSQYIYLIILPMADLAVCSLRSCQGDLSLFIKSRLCHLAQSLLNRLLPFDPPSPIHTCHTHPSSSSHGSGDH